MSKNCENLLYRYKKCLNDLSTKNQLDVTKTTTDCFFYWNELLKCIDKREKEKNTELKNSKL